MKKNKFVTSPGITIQLSLGRLTFRQDSESLLHSTPQYEIYTGICKPFNTPMDRKVAIKIWPLPENPSKTDQIQQMLKNEVHILCNGNNYTTKMVGYAKETYILDTKYSLLVTELFEYQTLEKFVSRPPISPQTLRIITFHLLRAYELFHKKNIFHLEVNPQNILIDPKTLNIKLWNFSSSKIKTNNTTFNKPEDAWTSPERSQAKTNKANSDIWSLGSLIYYVATQGKVLFRNRMEIESSKDNEKIFQMYLKREVIPREYHGDLYYDLVQRMTHFNSNDRIPLKDAITHPALWDSNRIFAFLNQLTKYAKYEEDLKKTQFEEDLEGKKLSLLGRPDWNLEELKVVLKNSSGYDTRKMRELILFIRNEDQHEIHDKNVHPDELLRILVEKLPGFIPGLWDFCKGYGQFGYNEVEGQNFTFND